MFSNSKENFEKLKTGNCFPIFIIWMWGSFKETPMRNFKVLIFLFFAQHVFAQNNEIIIRAKNLFSLDAKEEVFSDNRDTSSIIPTEKDNYLHYDVDIAYLKKYKSVKWLIRLGFDKVVSDDQLILARSTGHSVSNDDRKRKTIRFATGIYYPAKLADERLALNFILIGGFDYQYFRETGFYSEFYDNTGNIEASYQRTLKYPDSWWAKIETGSGLYYYFFPNVGIGAEFSAYLYYNKMKGTTTDSFSAFDALGNIEESIVSEHVENWKSIGLRTSYSIGLTYKF